MGNYINLSNDLKVCFCGKRTYQIRVSGPAQAGKTSIIKWLKYKRYIRSLPTEGFDVDKVEYKDCFLVMWDSRQNFGDIVHPQHLDVVAIIYVVDSSDPGRIRIANRTLVRILNEVQDAAVLLVLATKQDKPGALPVEDIREMLMLHNIHDKECGVFACSAKTGEGIEDGVDWMCKELEVHNWQNTCSCSSIYTKSICSCCSAMEAN